MSSAFPQILVMSLFVIGLALLPLWLDWREIRRDRKTEN